MPSWGPIRLCRLTGALERNTLGDQAADRRGGGGRVVDLRVIPAQVVREDGHDVCAAGDRGQSALGGGVGGTPGLGGGGGEEGGHGIQVHAPESPCRG